MYTDNITLMFCVLLHSLIHNRVILILRCLSEHIVQFAPISLITRETLLPSTADTRFTMNGNQKLKSIAQPFGNVLGS